MYTRVNCTRARGIEPDFSAAFLFVNNHCISDPTAGVTQSLRTIAEWLADAGHEIRILTTARFESPVTFTIEDHLRQLGVPLDEVRQRRPAQRRGQTPTARRPVVRYTVRSVPVTLLLNSLNRSLGQDDAYPFALSEQALRKLRFVHDVIAQAGAPVQADAQPQATPA